MKYASSLLICLTFVMPAMAAHDSSKTTSCAERGKMTVRFSEVHIREALRVFAKQARVNIAVSPELRGNVTLDSQCEARTVVLERILSQVNASYCIERDVVRIFPKHTSNCGGQLHKIYELLE